MVDGWAITENGVILPDTVSCTREAAIESWFSTKFFVVLESTELAISEFERLRQNSGARCVEIEITEKVI